ATPERLSPAVSSTVTARLLQSEMSETFVVGAVRSILTGALVSAVALLARSRTEVPAVRPVPSPSMVLSAGAAPSRPESAAAAGHVTVSASLYQPAQLGSVVAVPLRVGAVLSTLIGPTVTVSLLPA